MSERDDNPYIGPRPYERADRPLFFGRDSEVRQLLSLVIAHRVVLLYATSGAGKTSLLNAGLLPLLEEEEGFEVFPPARVAGAPLPDGVTNPFVHNVIENWRRDLAADDPAFVADGEPSLAQFLGLRDHSVDSDGLARPRLVVFDQFEEVFTLYQQHWRQREPFFAQLAELLAGDPLLRVVIAIREDYLAQLDRYGPLLPGRLRTRLQLERLRRDAALTAVTHLAARTPRQYAPGVAEQLVGDLLELRVDTGRGEIVAVEGEYVEPVQLQVACRSLWDALPPDVVEITADHLEQFGDVDEVLSRFYSEAVAAAAEAGHIRERGLRAALERTFITSGGTRGTVYAESRTTGGIPSASIDELERQHLIRAEFRAGARWLELTHDRLIDPIKTSNRAFSAAFRRRRRRRVTVLAVAAALTASLAILAIGFKAGQSSTSQPGTTLASGGADGTVRLWDTASHKQLGLPLTGHRGSVFGVAFNSDGITLASGGADGTVRLWDTASHKQLGLPLTGHRGSVDSVAFSPDGRTLASGGADGTVRLWDTASHRQLGFLKGQQGPVYRVAFSPDGKTLASSGDDGTVVLWDAARGNRKLADLDSSQSRVYGVAYSPDGRTLAAAGSEGRVMLWDAARDYRKLAVLDSGQSQLYGVAFSPDGRTLAAAGSEGRVMLWDAAHDYRKLAVLDSGRSQVYGVAFSPDGTTLAAAAADATVRLWDTSSYQQLGQPLTGHTGPVDSVSFS